MRPDSVTNEISKRILTVPISIHRGVIAKQRQWWGQKQMPEEEEGERRELTLLFPLTLFARTFSAG